MYLLHIALDYQIITFAYFYKIIVVIFNKEHHKRYIPHYYLKLCFKLLKK